MKKIKNLQSGQSLIELLVTMGIAAIIFPALMTGLVATRNGKAQQIQRTQAVALLKETQEIIRVVRENNWSYVGNLSENDIVHPVASGNTWVFANGSELVTTTLTRQIVAHNVYRNNGTIVTSGGTLDPSTKKLVTTISWNTPIANSVSATTYITRFNNTSYTEKTNVVVTNTSGGEVTLGAGGGGDWCNPNLSITALDLPKNGVANAVTAIEGRAFAGTGDNSSG